MKKNLRIVSVAAAALLAVAPVAASTVSTVSADAITNVTSLTGFNLPNDAKVNVTPNVTLNTSVGTSVKAALNASFSVDFNGTTAVSTFDKDHSSVSMWYETTENGNVVNHPIHKVDEVNSLAAGTLFKLQLNNVSLNFGTKNANKDITLVLPNENGNTFEAGASKLSYKTKTDSNGVVTIPQIVLGVYAKNFANPTVVEWYNAETGVTVKSGNVELNAGSDAGKMNVAQVASAIAGKYRAHSLQNTTNNHISYTAPSEIADQLKKQGIPVDSQGWFTAPKSFTVNYTATSAKNNASSTLAVTVSVPNGKDLTPATVPSQSKTIMHNAYFYDKDAKRVGTDKVTRYNTVTVAMNTTKLANGISYYEVIENGKATGKYINADNIDGTKRTLKHNAYVYKTSKKRANKVVLKKGTEVTTYGGAYTFKNGKKYYKIGADTKKTYVKVANFE